MKRLILLICFLLIGFGIQAKEPIERILICKPEVQQLTAFYTLHNHDTISKVTVNADLKSQFIIYTVFFKDRKSCSIELVHGSSHGTCDKV